MYVLEILKGSNRVIGAQCSLSNRSGIVGKILRFISVCRVRDET